MSFSTKLLYAEVSFTILFTHYNVYDFTIPNFKAKIISLEKDKSGIGGGCQLFNTAITGGLYSSSSRKKDLMCSLRQVP